MTRQIISAMSLLLAVYFSGNAQGTYVYKFHELTSTGSIYDLTDGQLTLLSELENSEPKFGDIAVGPDGFIYGITPLGSIRRINLSDGSTNEILAFSDTTIHTALTCDQQGTFYALDSFTFNLIAINLSTQVEETLLFVGENTPGDISFYKGHIVFISGEGVIKAINLSTNEVSTIYCIPDDMVDMTALWGINNVFDSCGTEHLLVGNYFNEIYQIDIENDTYFNVNPVYDIDLGGTIHGMASSNDLLSSQCNGDVTHIDCITVGFEDFSVTEISIYPNPSQGEIWIESSNSFQRIEFFTTSGILVKQILNPSSIEPIEDLNKGFYILKFYDEQGRSQLIKLIKS